MKLNPVFLMLAFCIVCCSKPVPENEIAGTYSWSQRSMLDSIMVYPDGTYIHRQYNTNDKYLEQKGIWSYNPSSRYILFENFSFFDGFLPSGNWFSEVSRGSGNRIELNYSRDENIHYSKIK